MFKCWPFPARLHLAMVTYKLVPRTTVLAADLLGTVRLRLFAVPGSVQIIFHEV